MRKVWTVLSPEPHSRNSHKCLGLKSENLLQKAIGCLWHPFIGSWLLRARSIKILLRTQFINVSRWTTLWMEHHLPTLPSAGLYAMVNCPKAPPSSPQANWWSMAFQTKLMCSVVFNVCSYLFHGFKTIVFPRVLFLSTRLSSLIQTFLALGLNHLLEELELHRLDQLLEIWICFWWGDWTQTSHPLFRGHKINKVRSTQQSHSWAWKDLGSILQTASGLCLAQNLW